MPVYPYACVSCKKDFEILCSLEHRDSQSCPHCGASADRVEVTGFAVNSSVDPKNKTAHSANEVDVVVGTLAEKQWQDHEKRVQERRNRPGYTEKDVVVPANSTFNPLEILGSQKRRELGKMNSEALKAHREQRVSEGKGQFGEKLP